MRWIWAPVNFRTNAVLSKYSDWFWLVTSLCTCIWVWFRVAFRLHKNKTYTSKWRLQADIKYPIEASYCCTSETSRLLNCRYSHDDIIKCTHLPRQWPFVRGIHRSPVDSPHKGHVTGTFDVPFLLIRTDGWTNTRLTGNSRRHDSQFTSL